MGTHSYKKTQNPQFQLEVLLHIDIGVQRFPINGPPAEIKVGGVLNSMLWQNILRTHTVISARNQSMEEKKHSVIIFSFLTLTS